MLCDEGHEGGEHVWHGAGRLTQPPVIRVRAEASASFATSPSARAGPNQLGGQVREPLVLCFGVTPINDEVLALGPPVLTEVPAEVCPD